MSITLVALGVVSLFLVGVHIVAGGKQVAGPMLEADFDRTAKLTIYVCWHYITAHLLLGGAVLLWAGLDPTVASRAVAAAVSATYLVCAALFVVVAARSRLPGAWHKLGQWIAFLPMGVAGLVAAA